MSKIEHHRPAYRSMIVLRDSAIKSGHYDIATMFGKAAVRMGQEALAIQWRELGEFLATRPLLEMPPGWMWREEFRAYSLRE